MNPFTQLKWVYIEVDGAGYNKWNTEKKTQSRLIEKMPAAEVEKLINQLMMHQPK